MLGEEAGLAPGEEAGLVPGEEAGLEPGEEAGLVPGEEAGLAPGEANGLTLGDITGLVPVADRGTSQTCVHAATRLPRKDSRAIRQACMLLQDLLDLVPQQTFGRHLQLCCL